MDDLDEQWEFSIEVVYVDDHLMQLQALVKAGNWRGKANAYDVREDIAAFASSLKRFADGTETAAEFSTGAENGIGMIGLRFYRIDRSGHIACHVRLASGDVATEHRTEQVSQLAIEIYAKDNWAVGRFAVQLAEIAHTQSGRAVLIIERRV